MGSGGGAKPSWSSRSTFGFWTLNGSRKFVHFSTIIWKRKEMRYLLSLQTSNLSIAHETRDSFSSSFSQIFLVYLQPFRGSSTFEVCTGAENSKKTLKLPTLGVQGHSRSSMSIPLKSSSLVILMIAAYLGLSATVFTLDTRAGFGWREAWGS